MGAGARTGALAGVFGENLTTRGLDVSGTVIGERWRVGDVVVLEASATRIPCRTFADRLGQESWIKRFGRRALPGVYFRVVVPGHVAAGAPVTLLSRTDHGVTSAMVLRALTGQRELLPRLLEADALSPVAERVGPQTADPAGPGLIRSIVGPLTVHPLRPDPPCACGR